MRWIALSVALLGFTFSIAQAGEGKKIEVKAQLVEIPSTPPPNDLYDYAYVMKYKVQGGELDGQTLLVAHYKPRTPRKKIKDKMKKFVKGKLKKFKEGAVHKMVLDPNLQKIWPDALVDEYFATDKKSTRYWCLKVDPS